MFKCVYAWRIGDNWYYWGPHYGPSICKCANTAQGESKIVASALVTFRSLFKHVCKVSWYLIAYTWTSEQRLLSPKDLSTGRILNSLSVGVMWPYFLFPNSLTAKFWTQQTSQLPAGILISIQGFTQEGHNSRQQEAQKTAIIILISGATIQSVIIIWP